MNVFEIKLETSNDILLKIENINVGDFVKVSNFEERFWVKIISIENNKISGKIDNYLLNNKLYDINSLVTLDMSNILDYIKYS
tara:strand:- start:387 stop:635 length:249 start_codon:yes stop_codon:yes gene_type:complete